MSDFIIRTDQSEGALIHNWRFIVSLEEKEKELERLGMEEDEHKKSEEITQKTDKEKCQNTTIIDISIE